jgi:hypothetical protein
MPPLKTNRYIPTDKDEAFSQIWQEVGDLRTDISTVQDLLDATATTKQIIDMIKPLAREAFTFELPITYDKDKNVIGYRGSSINHELLSGLLGGAPNDHYHLTAAQVAVLHPAITINDTASVDLALTGQLLSATVLPAGVDHSALASLNTASYSHLTTTEIATLRVALEPMGFPNRTDTTLSWSDANKRFTITGTNFAFYVSGVKYVRSTESVDITDTFGLWYIYYNSSGVLTASQSLWSLSTTVPIATVYWNGTNGLLSEERHGITMDWSTHQWAHDTIGCRYESGFALTVTNSASWSLAAGIFHDEDIEHSYTAKTQARIFYRGASGFTFTAATGNLFLQVASVLQYNNGTSLADVSSAKFMAMWMFATPELATPISLIMGQREDNTIALARTNNTYESLVLGSLPYPEMKLLYRIIIKRNGAGVDYIEATDYRSVSNLSSGTYIATAHSSLTGLTVDDHTQYLLADGTRSMTGNLSLIGTLPTTRLASNSTTDTDHGTIQFAKSSSATIGALATTDDGEYIGEIVFRGVNAAGTPAEVSQAKILVRQVGAAGASYNGAKIDFQVASNTAAIATKMTLDESGNLSLIENLISATGKYIGLGASAGRFVFTDAATDTVTLQSAYLGLNIDTPTCRLHAVEAAASLGMLLQTYCAINTASVQFGCYKSASDTKGTLLACDDGEYLGYIFFASPRADNAAYTTSVAILAKQVGAAGATSNGGSLTFLTSTAGAGSTPALIIDNLQNVSIGNVAADSRLHVWSATAGVVSAVAGTMVTVENSDNAYISVLTPANKKGGVIFGDDNEDGNVVGSIIYDHATDKMGFTTGGTIQAVLDSTALTLTASLVVPTANFIGISSSKGRLVFTDTTIDTIAVTDANLHVGTIKGISTTLRLSDNGGFGFRQMGVASENIGYHGRVTGRGTAEGAYNLIQVNQFTMSFIKVFAGTDNGSMIEGWYYMYSNAFGLVEIAHDVQGSNGTFTLAITGNYLTIDWAGGSGTTCSFVAYAEQFYYTL